MGPAQNDDFAEQLQDGNSGGRRICLLKGCEHHFRRLASPAEVLFRRVRGKKPPMADVA